MWLRLSRISPLRDQIDRGCSEKLALEHEVRVLRGNLESRDKNMEELRAEISRQLHRYNDLWCVHGTSLEVQTLRSEVIALRYGVQVESAGRWLGGENRNPEGPLSWPGGRVVSLGDWPIMLRDLTAGMRDLEDGQDRGSGRKRGK